jgi:hypothetical protein
MVMIKLITAALAAVLALASIDAHAAELPAQYQGTWCRINNPAKAKAMIFEPCTEADVPAFPGKLLIAGKLFRVIGQYACAAMTVSERKDHLAVRLGCDFDFDYLKDPCFCSGDHGGPEMWFNYKLQLVNGQLRVR